MIQTSAEENLRDKTDEILPKACDRSPHTIPVS